MTDLSQKGQVRMYRRGGQYPVDLEAIQFNGNNGPEIELWLGVHCSTQMKTVARVGGNTDEDFSLVIPGIGTAEAGDYIAKNLDGTVVILKPDYFESEFQEVITFNTPEQEHEGAVPDVDDGALKFLKKFCNGYRIVSTCDLTELQIAEANVEGRLYIEPEGGFGWVALPWELTTVRDWQREKFYQINKQLIEQTDTRVAE